MTIAVDRSNGKVLGQIVTAGPRDEGAGFLRLLTASGYCTVPRESVRLEKVS